MVGLLFRKCSQMSPNSMLAVMNYTEMEAKVREATNNEPWGASTSMMQEIASGTHN
jgi:hypothetical protein